MGKIEQKNLRFNLALVDHVKAYELIQNFDRNEYHNLSDYIVDCLIKFDDYERSKDKNKEYLLIDQLQEQIEKLEIRIEQLENKENEGVVEPEDFELPEDLDEWLENRVSISEFYEGLHLE